MSEKGDYLLLKWGTVKGWHVTDPAALDLLKKYFAEGVPMSAMADHPSAERRDILCALIREHKGDIQNDWSGESYTKEQAIEYVMKYGS